MTGRRTRYLWQAVALWSLMLMAHLSESARGTDSAKKKKCKPKDQNTDCKDCILVKPNYIESHSPPITTRDIQNRSIVPWVYLPNTDTNRIPKQFFYAKCSDQCKGTNRDLNAVPIEWEIQVLQKENKYYRLKKIKVVVGCTCVEPEIVEND